MKHNPSDICPRCNEEMGPIRPALSRLTRGDERPQVWVCAFCGVQEAIDQYANNGVAVDWRK